MKTTTHLILSDEVLKSPNIAQVFSTLGMQLHLDEVRETKEFALQVRFHTRYPLGPSFRLGNAEFTVPWQHVRAIVAVDEPRSGAYPKRTLAWLRRLLDPAASERYRTPQHFQTDQLPLDRPD